MPILAKRNDLYRSGIEEPADDRSLCEDKYVRYLLLLNPVAAELPSKPT